VELKLEMALNQLVLMVYVLKICGHSVNLTNTNFTPTRHFYGWKRGTPNANDEFHNFIVNNTLDNIKLVDLRSTCPAIYNQDKLGSCTANAIAAVYEYDEIKQNEKSLNKIKEKYPLA